MPGKGVSIGGVVVAPPPPACTSTPASPVPPPTTGDVPRLQSAVNPASTHNPTLTPIGCGRTNAP